LKKGDLNMFCPTCGKVMASGTRFCGECGAGIPAGNVSSAPASSVATSSSVAETNATVPKKEALSVWQGVLIAVGLLVLLVGLGAALGESATPLAGLMVLGTTVWACIDSYQIRRVYKARDTTAHPVGLFLCMTLLWIVVFPGYLVTRSRVLVKLKTVPMPVAPPAQQAPQSLLPPNADEVGPVANYSKAHKWVGPLIAVVIVVYGVVNHNVSETFKRKLNADASWADVVKSFFSFGSDGHPQEPSDPAATKTTTTSAQLAVSTSAPLTPVAISSNTTNGLQDLKNCAHEQFDDACLQIPALQDRVNTLLGTKFDYSLGMERQGAIEGDIVTLSGSEPHAVNLAGAAISADIRSGTVVVAAHALNELTVYGAKNKTMESLPPRIRAWIAGRQTGTAQEQNPVVTVSFQ
jgi:hypothetical protein